MKFKCNLSQAGLSFVFNEKKTSLNSFSFKGFSRIKVVIFGGYDSKLVFLYGISVASLDPTFTNKLLNFLAVGFLSVISFFSIIKLFWKSYHSTI